MKKWWVKIYCLLLVLNVLAGAVLPAAATEEEDNGVQEDTTKDYVVLLDCSQSTSTNDTKNLTLQAFQNFLDKLPLYDTRLSIITFGYESDIYPGYSNFDSFEVNSIKDKALIHVVVPLSELTSSADRAEYKKLVEKELELARSGASTKTFTPYTHALAAAVDMLEKNTDSAKTRNACIILITDGVLDDREYYKEGDDYGVSQEAERLLNEASLKAGTHDWPIYSIQLNYANGDAHANELATGRLTTISANGGENAVGSVACEDKNGVFTTLMAIFDDFMGRQHKKPLPVILPNSVYFDIATLTSEASIDIFGEGISSVSLYHVDENNNRIREYRTNISRDIDEKSLMVTVNEGYYSIKLICPDEGRWEVFIDGTGGVEVLVSNSALQEMRLNMVAEPVLKENPLTKNNTIEVEAFFAYHGQIEDNNRIYEAMPATLKVFDMNNRTILSVDQNNTDCYKTDATGYRFVLPLSNFPNEEAIKLQVVVEDGMFRDGIKHSNIVTFAFKDLKPEPVPDCGPITLEEHVGGVFRQDIRQIFVNPDNDLLEFVLTCVNNATAVFECSVNQHELQIPAGLQPGEYKIKLAIVGEDVSYDDLTLVVVNDIPRLTDEIDDVVLWKKGFLAMPAKNTYVLDLNDYFVDPETMKLTFSHEVSEEGVVEVERDDNILTISTIDGVKGEITIKVSATDKITPDSIVETTFKVSAVSGFALFVKQNLVWIILIVIASIVTAIAIAIAIHTYRVKGVWRIIVDENGEHEEIPSINFDELSVSSKKSKFLVKDLMTELGMMISDRWSTTMDAYFGQPDADKLMMVGTNRAKGCKVINIPKDNKNILVNAKGRNVTKSKIRFYSGTLTIVVEKDDYTGERCRLTVTMTLM